MNIILEIVSSSNAWERPKLKKYSYKIKFIYEKKKVEENIICYSNAVRRTYLQKWTWKNTEKFRVGTSDSGQCIFKLQKII